MRIVAASLAAVALLAAPAAAEQYRNWGAIAFGGAPGTWGAAVDYATAGEARDAALAACTGGCSQTMVFQRNCGAVAVSNGSVFVSRNRWQGRAIARALGLCRDRGGDCELLAWACTNR